MGTNMHANNVPSKDTTPLLGVSGRHDSIPVLAVSRPSHGEGSPAYAVLEHLLEVKYRINCAEDIAAIPANAKRSGNLLLSALLLPRCFGMRTFEVPKGQVKLADDGHGNYELYGPGVHRRHNFFMRVGKNVDVAENEWIQHGDRTIVTIKQGHIGYCEDMGQPVLLPPGLHEWRSSTLKFKESVDLNNSIIRLGPYTILTVDEGYQAITQDNGQQVILPGGQTHLLSHRNWKFEKFMTEKIQTNDLEHIEATSADNVMMHTDATVVWRVSDVHMAAKWSAETMRTDGADAASAARSDIQKLRNDVLKQASASLAAFIEEIRYSDSFHISAAGSGSVTAVPIVGDGQQPMEAGTAYSPIFDVKRMASAVESANAVTSTYGVTIISINIISAVPADSELRSALAKGAVASAEAEQAETVAGGQAKAARIMAEGEAMAEKIRADGARAAADLLASSDVAVELCKIDKVGGALKGGGTNTLFFGADAANMGGLMSNPAVVRR